MHECVFIYPFVRVLAMTVATIQGNEYEFNHQSDDKSNQTVVLNSIIRLLINDYIPSNSNQIYKLHSMTENQ